MSLLRLELLNPTLKGKSVPFKSGLTIGSGAESTVRAQHPDMRPLHARLVEEDGKPMIEIAGDDSHIKVNGRDVVRAELRHQDEVQVGPLRLRVVDTSRASQITRLDVLMADYESKQAEEIHDFAREDLFYLVTKDQSLRQAVSFVIPSRDRFIEQAQVFVNRLAKGAGLDEDRLDAFMTCAKELILNAHRHGHKYDGDKKITVRWRDQGQKVQLSIQDEGPGFDHRSVIGGANEKNAADAARERYLAGGFGGLGFQLITKLADELKYNDPGNEVTITINKKATAA